MFAGMTLACLIGIGLGMLGLTIRRRVSPWLSLSQRVRARMPSLRKPASREMISASVKLCETEVCFLHIQLTGTSVLLPKIHKTPPEVDFESSRSSAKSES